MTGNAKQNIRAKKIRRRILYFVVIPLVCTMIGAVATIIAPYFYPNRDINSENPISIVPEVERTDTTDEPRDSIFVEESPNKEYCAHVIDKAKGYYNKLQPILDSIERRNQLNLEISHMSDKLANVVNMSCSNLIKTRKDVEETLNAASLLVD